MDNYDNWSFLNENENSNAISEEVQDIEQLGIDEIVDKVKGKDDLMLRQRLEKLESQNAQLINLMQIVIANSVNANTSNMSSNSSQSMVLERSFDTNTIDYYQKSVNFGNYEMNRNSNYLNEKGLFYFKVCSGTIQGASKPANRMYVQSVSPVNTFGSYNFYEIKIQMKKDIVNKTVKKVGFLVKAII